ncbi:U6 small nuclear RNA (adenine-(43)-N(6))-methyltransferase [Chelonus insularis]|uniref:U6 small nuclear RNA (adenine-(43)-N(6))-methyltransferase n=1 Tax=Chelonus insularis TaxID=460826 RepID=UPI00158B59AE|nr:U6 small nuclear RNA (adenine-(43)-N(6))-methyltransferase [Chelonus insularis]
MSLRKFMHPENKYKTPPNFKELANLYSDFRENVTVDLSGKLRYNFNSGESLRILTKTLLQHDFNINVKIPVDKLVPALPLRLNYVHWINDLTKHAGFSEVSGIDIGTGAIAIYPLLCAKLYGWKIIGTDIDDSTIKTAKDNIKKNNLEYLINIISVDGTNIIKDAVLTSTYSFTMCNPPFFDVDDINGRKKKRTPPKNASTGSEAELLVDGGEKSFVSKMMDESLELKNQVKIYTTMLGQKTSLAFCRSELKKRNIENSTWTEFCQGHTKRWGLAWTFMSKDQLNLSTAPVIRTRLVAAANKSKDHNTTELKFPFNDKYKNIENIITAFKEWINELKIEIKEIKLDDEETNCWTCQLTAQNNTWTHARRKRRIAMQLAKRDSKKSRLSEDEETTSSIVEEKNNDESPVDSSPTEHHLPFLNITLGIGKLNEGSDGEENKEENEYIKIFMIYHNGEGGKNGLESFKQYLINKLGIRDYFQQRNKQINSKSPKKKKKKRMSGK